MKFYVIINICCGEWIQYRSDVIHINGGKHLSISHSFRKPFYLKRILRDKSVAESLTFKTKYHILNVLLTEFMPLA
jgi:hypothetical protein